MTTEPRTTNQVPGRLRWTIGAFVFLAIAAFFLFTEHRAHLLGALPYLLLLTCPLVHLFMHHGHHGRGRDAGTSHGAGHEIGGDGRAHTTSRGEP